MPVPEPCLVVPTTVCARMNAALDAGDQRLVEQVAELIVAAVPADAVSLRSSSTLEDMPDGTAAGIYHSEAGVPARPDAVATVLARILRSRTSDRAQAYHQHHNRDSDGGLAILVTEYQRFSFQGTALSHDPWHNDQTVVEYYESDGSGGCPDRGGEVVCFPHATLASRAALTTIPHLMADLNAVARAAYALSQRAGSPIEVEWGLREHRLTLLQARQIAPPHQGT